MPYKNREDRLAAQKRWYERNREYQKQKAREWRADNALHKKRYDKTYRREHRSELNASKQRWRLANVERESNTKAAWRKRNTELTRLYTRRSYAKNREAKLAYGRWYRNKAKPADWDRLEQHLSKGKTNAD